MSRTKNNSGFTLLELIITMSILAPILFAVLSTSGVVSDTVSVNESASKTSRRMQDTTRRLAEFIRPASLATLRVQDAKGAWVLPQEKVTYDSLQFRVMADVPTKSQAPLSDPRFLMFRRDPRELPDGRDNDKDGLVDEGVIVLTTSGTRAVLARNVERFVVSRVGRTVTLNLAMAIRDRKGGLHRVASVETINMRNN